MLPVSDWPIIMISPDALLLLVSHLRLLPVSDWPIIMISSDALLLLVLLSFVGDVEGHILSTAGILGDLQKETENTWDLWM